ncbi:MAG: isopentenyl phosphate kinase [Candidatus Micrarchaeia archaeon]
MQVLKLGGSVLTKKQGYMEPDNSSISSLAEMLSHTWKDGTKDMLLVHGAGSFGHPLVVKYGLNNGVKTEEQKLGAAKTHSACVRLSGFLVDALCKQGVPAVSVPPAFVGKMNNRKLIEFTNKPVKSLLELGYLPVLHGDMLPDSELGCAVCSGDQLVSWFGKNADRIVLGTNVDGVLADGKLVPEITQGNFAEVSAHFAEVEYADVTGGMKGKIKELLGLGVPSYIVNARYPERIEALLRGKSTPSTLVK